MAAVSSTAVNTGPRPLAKQLIFTVVKRLAALLLPQGFGLGEFVQTAKTAFVAAAAESILLRGDRVSTSRIAAISGISRAEVANIRSNGESPIPNSSRQRTERVMHGWYTDPRFVDNNGNPRMLPIIGAASFAELVRRFSGDIPRRAVLEELLAAGMVQQSADGRLRAVRRHYASSGGSNTDLESLVVDARIIFGSTTGNRTKGRSPRRRVTVRFPGQVPASVRRNIALRTERFLDALSEYLHTESAHTQDTGHTSDHDGESVHVLIAQAEIHDER